MSATMMNHSRRQILTPGPSNNKRKERDRLDGFKPSAITTKNLAKPSIHRAPTPLNKSSSVLSPKPASPSASASASASASNNQLLAGYLAHEFLTKGTLFGEPWDPARAEAVPVSSPASDRAAGGGVGIGRAYTSSNNEKRKAEPLTAPSGNEEKRVEKQQRYLEVADLLRGDRAHLPGIVNPTQLARFLQLG